MPQEFDAVAQEYDSTFSHTAVGRLLRERVWEIIRGTTSSRATNMALELNCGTGEDAIWMAKQGWQVLATDASAEMVAVSRAKASIQLSESFELSESSIQFQTCPFTEIENLSEGNFDLIFSNFGGLNCIPPEDLRQLGKAVAQKLKPGGKFIAIVMGRFCWWETLYFLLKGKPCEAFRRLGKKPVDARLDAKTTVPTWYYAPSEFKKHLHFTDQKSTIMPIGLWLPPSYLNPFFEKRPRLLACLNFLEKKLAPSWLAMTADHFLICLESTES
jgi:SAM-dependent methyltransferase